MDAWLLTVLARIHARTLYYLQRHMRIPDSILCRHHARDFPIDNWLPRLRMAVSFSLPAPSCVDVTMVSNFLCNIDIFVSLCQFIQCVKLSPRRSLVTRRYLL
ncbi:hypothetical protein C8J57DRAFT_1337640 [Mycena rebaudengoi]|nr:hypothetical protein C8J57DRAFT_1337640 [Mycena rebaudengoi]